MLDIKTSKFTPTVDTITHYKDKLLNSTIYLMGSTNTRISIMRIGINILLDYPSTIFSHAEFVNELLSASSKYSANSVESPLGMGYLLNDYSKLIKLILSQDYFITIKKYLQKSYINKRTILEYIIAICDSNAVEYLYSQSDLDDLLIFDALNRISSSILESTNQAYFDRKLVSDLLETAETIKNIAISAFTLTLTPEVTQDVPIFMVDKVIDFVKPFYPLSYRAEDGEGCSDCDIVSFNVGSQNLPHDYSLAFKTQKFNSYDTAKKYLITKIIKKELIESQTYDYDAYSNNLGLANIHMLISIKGKSYISSSARDFTFKSINVTVPLTELNFNFIGEPSPSSTFTCNAFEISNGEDRYFDTLIKKNRGQRYTAIDSYWFTSK